MPSNKPKLSILLSAYNAEKYISEALDSILSQTFEDFELIIADDGSDDLTKAVIDKCKDPRIIRSHNNSNKGKIGTCNRLFELAKGKYVTIHDADDISHKSRLKKQIEFLESDSELKMCGTAYAIFWKNHEILAEQYLESNFEKLRSNSRSESQFHGPTVVFEKDIIHNIGGLFRFFKQGEDVDLSMRIAEKYKTTNLQDVLYFYRWHEESITKSVSSFSIERLVKTKLIFHLREERDSNNGVDSLMEKNYPKIEGLLEEWKKEYKDPSYIYRFGAAKTLGTNMFKNSILLSFKALRVRPNFENLRCTLYCIRISLAKNFKSLIKQRKHIKDFQ